MDQKKYSWADNLRVLATISMVLLHVTSPILLRYGKISTLTWHAGNVIDSSVRFCVPVFVMLSGALLLHKDYSIRDFLMRRVVRVLCPFVFYTAVYIIYSFRGKSFIADTKTVLIIWNKIAHGAAYHLWYIYMIIGLYLFIPVIGRWVRASTKRELQYFIILWMGTLVVSHPFLLKHKPNFDLSYFSGFLGYLILGYYLSQLKFDGRWKRHYSLILLVAGIAVTMAGTIWYSNDKGSLNTLFYGFLTPNVLLTSAGVFMLVGNFTFSISLAEQLRLFLCKYSFGIYLIHVLVLSELNKVGLDCFYIHPALGIALTTFVCIAISGAIVYLIARLPGGKYISG